MINKIDWTEVAAKYVFRKVQMEDHLADYIYKLACYRNVKEEKFEKLEMMLMKLSESCPKDIMEIMPPHLSGMVYNKTRIDKKTGCKSLDIKDILKEAPDKFTMREDGLLTYHLPELTKQEAIQNLRETLVKGVFIYFLAKFAHGPIFKIRPDYYSKSEPVKTTMQMITGESSIMVGLTQYFEDMKAFFYFNRKEKQLTLVNDYFNKDYNRGELQTYLNKKEPFLEVEIEKKPGMTVDMVRNHEGWVRYVNDDRAIIQFVIEDENFNKSEAQFAFLSREKFKCRATVSYQDKIFFDAQFKADLPEGCTWICYSAWMDLAKIPDIEVIFIFC